METRREIGKVGGVVVVLSAIEQHASVEDVQREAIGALCVFAKDSSFNRRLIVESNGIRLLLRAMHQHNTIATIQEKSADALSKIAMEHKYCELIVAKEGVTIMLTSMKAHLSEADVQGTACCALSQNREDTRARIAEYGGISAVVRAMERHYSASVVQQWGCHALEQFWQPKAHYRSEWHFSNCCCDGSASFGAVCSSTRVSSSLEFILQH